MWCLVMESDLVLLVFRMVFFGVKFSKSVAFISTRYYSIVFSLSLFRWMDL